MVENIKGSIVTREFKTIGEFYRYITDTPINSVFSNTQLASVISDKNFAGTNSFEEATNLLLNGWSEMSNTLTQKLKVNSISCGQNFKQKNTYDVVGYQPCVPRYLQGVPTNMIRKVNIPIKNRVITITKSCNYSAKFETEQIVEESIKFLQLVRKIEQQGTKCNINIILGSGSGHHKEYVKVCIKNANERLNISKVSFSLVHPSMIRRIYFRYIEVSPTITSGYTRGYGTPITVREERKKYSNVCKGEYLIPEVLEQDVNSINDLKEFYVE